MYGLWADYVSHVLLTSHIVVFQKQHGQTYCRAYFGRLASEGSNGDTSDLQRYCWIIKVFQQSAGISVGFK